MANGPIAAATNQAGGLVYHWRAGRHRLKLWAPFAQAMATWLNDWEPPTQRLVLVGPSAGYNLPLHRLLGFSRVLVLEPDPLARWLLRRRVTALAGGRPDWTFIAEDHLIARPDRLGALVQGWDATAVLFCNVIGQVPTLVPAPAWDVHGAAEAPALVAVRSEVQRAIRGRGWASFHDRVSGPVAPAPQLESGLTSARRWSDAEVLQLAYAQKESSKASAPAVELVDHLSHGYFSDDLPHAYFSWQIVPGYYHLIEAVRGFG